MNDITLERLTPLSTPRNPAQPRKRRTAAQKAASRRNGSKSRGPITVHGKARSSDNSLQHGLLARRLIPPGDVRRDDKLYRQIRRQLVAELKPSTFTQFATVDRLAHAYLQRARATQLIELIQQPKRLAENESAAWQRLIECRHNLNALRQAAVIFRSDERQAVEIKTTRRLGKIVASWIGQVRADIADAAEFEAIPQKPPTTPSERMGRETDPDNPMRDGPPGYDVATEDAFAANELKELTDALNELGVAADRLVDAEYAAAVLNRPIRASRDDHRGIALVVKRLLPVYEQAVKREREKTKKLKRKAHRAQAQLAMAPEQLILLHRYQRRIDGDISKLLAEFRRY